MYIHRAMERTVGSMLKQGKVVLVTGARQVGKTTMLTHHLEPSFSYVSMEDPREFSLAQADALLFFESKELPLIIDEIQRVPDLFQVVKFIVDQSDDVGRIVLTGSQTYHLMKGVSESLAGRIRILEMAGLSLREIMRTASSSPYIPTKLSKKDFCAPDLDIWKVIHRGSMPELQNPDVDWDAFYSDYMAAYLERDVRALLHVRDEAKFYNFVVACASRSAQLFNASDVAEVVGIDYKTAQSWLSVLQASGIVRLLHPFWPNADKRLTKMPKLYFMDTGLVCHLTRWTNAVQLKTGAVAGHVFETFVVSEILKSFLNAGANMRDVWFYRDSKKREIDLVIQDGHTLHPIEIKTGVQIKTDAIKNFKCLDAFKDYEVGFGSVICQTKDPYLLSANVQAIPVWAI